MDILIIGGTRNTGYFLTYRFLEAGHRVTVLNRGITSDDLPEEVSRLRCDRTNAKQMRRALGGRQFDMVVDTVLYNGEEAEAIVDIFDGQVGHYVFISTGQVYLVRAGIERPYREIDYDGPLMAEPEENTYDYEEWLYGMGKRQAEDVLAAAHNERGFPYTSLRMPMVNSERDHFHRLLGYILRINDGGPILVPETPNYKVCNIYTSDVVEIVMRLLETGKGKGRAYNLAQDEVLSIDDFLKLLSDVMGKPADIVKAPRKLLAANGFLPDCSPFSDLWMSELDNSRSKEELGISYTPIREVMERIVTYHEETPPNEPPSYRRRHAEKLFKG